VGFSSMRRKTFKGDRGMGKGFAPEIPTTLQSSSKLNQKGTASMETLQTSLSYSFEKFPDPRTQRTQKHRLSDILAIAIFAVIAGAQGWEDMENYGLSKQVWLEGFLELPNGIPSDDTFRTWASQSGRPFQ